MLKTITFIGGPFAGLVWNPPGRWSPDTIDLLWGESGGGVTIEIPDYNRRIGCQVRYDTTAIPGIVRFITENYYGMVTPWCLGMFLWPAFLYGGGYGRNNERLFHPYSVSDEEIEIFAPFIKRLGVPLEAIREPRK